jgi:phosphoribosylanthranilate isomerase
MSALFVKICGLRARECVDAAINAGANAIGFVFAESPRRVTINEVRPLLDHAQARVTRVGVFRHPSPDEVRRVLDELPIDLVQSDVEDFERDLAFVDASLRLPVVRTGDGFAARLRRAITESGRVLVEGARSGAGQRVSLDELDALPDDTRSRVIVAGGLDPTNVREIIERTRPFGVDVSSGVERQPGEKDTHLIHQFVRAARDAERIST